MQFGESLYAQGNMPYGSESRKPMLHLFHREGAKGTKSLKEGKTFWGKEFRLRD